MFFFIDFVGSAYGLPLIDCFFKCFYAFDSSLFTTVGSSLLFGLEFLELKVLPAFLFLERDMVPDYWRSLLSF